MRSCSSRQILRLRFAIAWNCFIRPLHSLRIIDWPSPSGRARQDANPVAEFVGKDTLRLLPQGQRSQHGLLFCDEGLDALACEGDHLCELGFVEDLVLGGGLDFD
jgi:hypothetical protein